MAHRCSALLLLSVASACGLGCYSTVGGSKNEKRTLTRLLRFSPGTFTPGGMVHWRQPNVTDNHTTLRVLLIITQSLSVFAELVRICRTCCGLQSLSVFAEPAWSQRLLLFTEIASFVPPGSPYPLHSGGSYSSLFLPLLPCFTPLAAVSPRIHRAFPQRPQDSDLQKSHSQSTLPSGTI